MKRGSFVLAASPSDYGKPRPALIVQSDLFSALPSITICPLTSDLRDDVPLLRLTVLPTAANGLRLPSQIAIDKMTTLPLQRFSDIIGRADDALMVDVTRALALFLGVS